MHADKQKSVIAEACGWKPYEGATLIAWMWAPGHIAQVVPKWCTEQGNGLDNSGQYLMDLLDYLNDLNAMHEVENAVIKKDVRLYLRYGQELIKLSGQGMFDAMFSTSEQRAEAFLKTINKWEDSA